MANKTIYGKTAQADFVAKGLFQTVWWVPYSGRTYGAAPTEIITNKFLKNVQSVDAFALSPLNETTHFEAGYQLLTMNDGYTLQKFNLQVEGADVALPAILSGTDISQFPNVNINGTCEKGALYICTHNGKDASASLLRTDYALDVVPILENVTPGVTNGTSNYTISFRGDNPVVGSLAGKWAIAVEMLFEGGAIVNNDAPDGILTTFDLGKGNQSYLAPTTPVAKRFRTNYSDERDFFLKVMTGTGTTMTDVDTSVISFVQPTLTFTVAPAINTKLLLMYVVDATAAGGLPGYRGDLIPVTAAGVNGGFNQTWQEWQGQQL